jgi:predicted amidohydrolase
VKTSGIKVAAYQAPLLASGSPDALPSIARRVRECEAQGVTFLCCPEAIIGGLADYAENPRRFALPGELHLLGAALAPLASETVTTIVGFTEAGLDGRFYNSAVIFSRDGVRGVYRKLHPAIHRSVYTAGNEYPVFTVSGLTFGISICYDSTFAEPARRLVAQGATVLFVPTNNGLPTSRNHAELPAAARACDIARATENHLWVVRADVAGRTSELVSYGSSEIVSPAGRVVQAAPELIEGLIIAEIQPQANPFRSRTT